MRLSDFPRLPLAHLPTPMEPLPRLSAHLGGPEIWVKRDDQTGLAFGGNKTRKLEYLLGAARAAKADTLITCGGVQSNHVRQTAAAAAKHGFHCELVLTRVVPWNAPDYEETGNILLDRLLGAKVHLHAGHEDRMALMQTLADKLRAQGRKPFVMPSGGSTPTGALGYARAALEIVSQATDLGLSFSSVVHACASGATQAGLVTGLKALSSPIKVLGIDVDADAAGLRKQVTEVASGCAELLGSAKPTKEEIEVVPGYSGEAYGLPTEEMREAVHLAARQEGLLVDPVYTGKALSGLIGLIKDGRFKKGETVLFLHTGGLPGLFPYRDALVPLD